MENESGHIPGTNWPPGPRSTPGFIKGRGIDVQDGPGEKATARPPSAPPPFANRQQPSQVKLPSARDFQLAGTGLILPAVAGGTIVPFAPLKLAAGEVAAITSAVIFINAPTLLTDIFFSILINNIPVPGDDQLQSFPRVAQNLSIAFDLDIRVPSRALISGLITNRTAAGPWTVGFQLNGFRYPESDAVRFYGSNS
jgi:hypothetical protein